MKSSIAVLFFLAVLAETVPAAAVGSQASDPAYQAQTQDQVYGSQLMTQQERAEFRARMQAARTPSEREEIRRQHHEAMKKRALERGATLPDEPPQGGGMGRGGRGLGPGGGIGR